ncbi:helix-turn-helix domain-containing protein [Haloarchaeobius sp. HRN-SO-5]|uniref:helix-turn-helix domain-containing protein n=1 Tax=Haloarchaeobius sp. HRN-SO-5 TaxID=3446118 RepID=UPI003EBE8F9F
MIEECLVVEFAVTGDDCPFADATSELDTTVHCHPPQYRADGTTLLRFTATSRTDDLASWLDEDDRIAYLHVSDAGDGSNYRCLSKHPCVIHDLINTGFMAESLEYRNGRGIFSGGVVGYDVLRNVLETTQDAVGVDLKRVYPLDSSQDELIVKKWDLTPAQEEALRVGLEMNYLSVPREVTATDVADELGISKSAFLERLHRGEQHLLGQIFDDG